MENKNNSYSDSNCLEVERIKELAIKESKDPVVVAKELEELGLDFEDKNSFKILMGMQYKFESRFRESGALENLSKEDKDLWINRYLVCIEDEVRETREHLNIYPDVSVETNETEMKKEIIDILHFMMDEFISGGASYKDIEFAYLKEFSDLKETDNLIELAYNSQKDKVLNTYKEYSYDETCLLILNKLLDCSGQVRQCISWKHWKKPLTEINSEKLFKTFAITFKTFIDLCIVNQMDPSKIREIYISKNVENIRRQKHGY